MLTGIVTKWLPDDRADVHRRAVLSSGAVSRL
jgi:hypothetical protein